MKILHAGIFRDHELGGDYVLKSGFLKNGADHSEFDYPAVAEEFGPGEMNRRLIEASKGFDLLFIGMGTPITQKTLAEIRKAGTAVSIWYGDVRPKPEPWLISNLSECDVFFMTSAGDMLKEYFMAGRPGRAAFFLNPANPDLAAKSLSFQRSVDPPIFSGTYYSFMGEERRLVNARLCQRGDIRIIGSPDKFIQNNFLRRLYRRFKPYKYLRGDDYIEAIIRSRFGIGVSAFQDIKYYTSDRLAHYLTFSKLYLAYRFPGCDDIFTNGEHIVYFDNVDHMDRLIDYYLTNRVEAEEIGARGGEKMLTDYNSERMTRMMLDVLETGKSDMYPWVEVFS